MHEYIPALIEHYDPFRLLFTHSPDAILLVDAQCEDVSWCIVACNEVAGNMYGYLPTELTGQSLAVLDRAQVDPVALADTFACLQRDGKLRVEVVHYRKDGTPVVVDFSLALVPHEGSELILAIGRDITAHRRTERRLTTQHAVSRLLAEAGHFNDAVPGMLRGIGENLHWDLGALWCVDREANVLRCTATWQATPDTAAFEIASRQFSFPPGVGLPGQVWVSGEPLWLSDIRTASSFPRLVIAAQASLRSAFAFAIKGQTEIFGVMEFFSRETRFPEAELSEMAAAIGSQSGQYIERRRAEKAVRIGEARSGAILQAALDGIITIDHEGRITEFNPAAEQIFGYSRDEALGQEMAALIIPPSLRSQHRRGLADYVTTGEGRIIGQRIELVALRADGSEFPIELTVTRIPTEGPPSMTGFVRDITARKRTDEHLRFLAEASTMLAASLDYETTLASLGRLAVPRIADWCSINLLDDSGAFVRVVGTHVDPVKEAVLHDLRERYPPSLNQPSQTDGGLPTDRATLIPEITDAHLALLGQNEEQIRTYRAMGFMSAMIVPLHLGSRLLGIIILATGESGRRYGPDDLQLAEDVAQRAALAIDNARLYQDARAAIQLRDEFLSIASHELKTPVSALLGYSQLLQRRAADGLPPTERDRRALRVLTEQATRLSKLISSLLDVSRIETGHFPLNLQPIDLCQLAQRVADELQPTLDRHSLHCSFEAAPVVVIGDALHLEQVLQNLLQNAIKYSPHGGPIGLRVERHPDHAALIVSDQGIGIPPAARDHLFERFYRAANVAGKDISGIGIGLFVVKEIVSRHGGQIVVESKEGEGSTFTVRLPFPPTSPG